MFAFSYEAVHVILCRVTIVRVKVLEIIIQCIGFIRFFQMLEKTVTLNRLKLGALTVK